MHICFRPPFHLLFTLASVLSCLGCAATSPVGGGVQRFEYTDFVMAARAKVVVYGRDESLAREAGRAAIDRMHALDAVMSDYREDSELARLVASQFGRPCIVSDDLFRVLAQSQLLAHLSDGAFDVTIGPFSLLWRQARREGRLPDERALADARRRVGWRLLTLNEAERSVTLLEPEMRLDLGGIGKGFAVEEAMRELRRRGFMQCLVSLAGDVVVGDPPPGRDAWVVTALAGAGSRKRPLLLRNQAVSTSGDVEQFLDVDGTRYSHILDPRTGLGVVRHRSVTVIAPDGATADGLATALNVLGREGADRLLSSFPGASALFLEE